MAEERVARAQGNAESSPSTFELWDRADRACEEAEQLLAVHAISIQLSRDLIARSGEMLKTKA
jgi:hypothetical protein